MTGPGSDGQVQGQKMAKARRVGVRASKDVVRSHTATPRSGSSRASPAETPAVAPRRQRDATATAERILKSAITEFAAHGYAGARIDAIARRADANIRMLYHYFGSKNALYVKVLEAVFDDMRLQEQRLNLHDEAPLPAMIRLFDFTYDHFASNPLYIRILTSENLLGAKYLSRSARVSALSSPLLSAMRDVLRRGETEGVFRKNIDPLQLYVSMVAMSYFHISNAPTLSHLFNSNLSTTRWRAERRQHATDLFTAYLASVTA